MTNKREIPTLELSEGADGVDLAAERGKPNHSGNVAALFDVCDSKRTAEAKRRAQIALEIRELARRLNAHAGLEAGEWCLTCPHCDEVHYFSERLGLAYIRDGGGCPAFENIARLVADARKRASNGQGGAL